MANISIARVKEKGAESPSLFEEMKALAERIRHRAYELFQRRRDTEGSPVDDWLKAERGLIGLPNPILDKKNGQFQLQVAMPGFDANDVHMTAFPDTVTVRANPHIDMKQTKGTSISANWRKNLFRKFDLPAPIDLDKVTAYRRRVCCKSRLPRPSPCPTRLPPLRPDAKRVGF